MLTSLRQAISQKRVRSQQSGMTWSRSGPPKTPGRRQPARARPGPCVPAALLTAYAAGVDMPIACSLTGTDAQAQLGEWRNLLATSVDSVGQISRTELPLRLRNDLAPLEALIRLAQREKACCPFIGFTIAIGAHSLTLHVSVPEEAS
jgi:hypothetical protein